MAVLFYDGYDPKWVLGKDKGPPVEKKEKPPAAPAAPAAAAPKEKPGPLELKVPMCCEGCEQKLRDYLIEVEGVESVRVDPGSNKVVVTGKVKPEDMLKHARKVAKRAELWPQKKKDEKKDDKKDEGKNEGGGGAKKEDKKEPEKKPAGPPPPTLVELRVPVCCEGCAEKFYSALHNVEGVTTVNVSLETGKVTVVGKALKPEALLKAAKKVKQQASMWPQPQPQPQKK